MSFGSGLASSGRHWNGNELLKRLNAEDWLGFVCGTSLPLTISRHFPIKLSMSACSNDVFIRMYLRGLMLSNFTSHSDKSSSTVTLNLSHASCTISRAIFLCRVRVNSFAYFLKFNICRLLLSAVPVAFISAVVVGPYSLRTECNYFFSPTLCFFFCKR